ncbi:hypothetical protein [Terriglobus aquaticus]|uniref:Uncharacterized protein n=1 Tax=Terriglobus aquaticus TaxID=940139 RepID=A0ABW9KIP0_9BACT|nr:hypothetical protein [Terriglobus aquaticus]
MLVTRMHLMKELRNQMLFRTELRLRGRQSHIVQPLRVGNSLAGEFVFMAAQILFL